MTCLKLDALSVLSRMAVPASYDLLPGVTIHRQQDAAAGAGLDLPVDLVRSLASDSHADRRLDEYLMTRFGNFLDSHTVQVHLLDLQPVASLRRALGDGDGDATGRRKNGIWQQLMGAGMMMGGSTLTMGLSALAAMAGKALMLSMLSLVLSALSGMNGGGGGGGGGHSQKQTTYEIISKPIYTHGHSHSAELHHEPSGPAAGYGLYGRAKDESTLSASTASGVGSSALGAPPGPTYITQFPRSLQESAQVSHHSKKAEDEKASSGSTVGAANYDSLLIRNLQYVKGQDGRAKYAIASDLVPSETDYTASNGDEAANGASSSSSSTAPRKYASHDDPAARSFQLSAAEELLVHPVSFREPLPSDVLSLTGPGSSWEGITAAPSTVRPQVNPAFVVAKPVSVGEDLAGPASQAPRTVAYRAYS
ncbi:uncharacterized protein LOC117653112 [Thrips palmi]|uniref:Uncharacterized protein LOC117653112 n=1 Tax=Thrips palmi TaxID=161013 RepID=A0A6P9AAI4_THRPL|nr:uncharacterized protein LOC117653112 [Thrips palmi]